MPGLDNCSVIPRSLRFLRDVRLFEASRRCTFGISWAYLAVRAPVEPDCNTDYIVNWFLYDPGAGIVPEIPARKVSGSKRSFNYEGISRHFESVKVSFLVDHFFAVNDVCEESVVASCSNEEDKVLAEEK